MAFLERLLSVSAVGTRLPLKESGIIVIIACGRESCSKKLADESHGPFFQLILMIVMADSSVCRSADGVGTRDKHTR